MGWQDTKGQLLRALSPEGSAVGSDMQENPQKMGGMFMGMETWKGFPKNINSRSLLCRATTTSAPGSVEQRGDLKHDCVERDRSSRRIPREDEPTNIVTRSL